MSGAQRPGEPAGDRALPPPSDPWAVTQRPDPTVQLGDPGATVDFGRAQPTVRQPGPPPPAHAVPTAATVHLDPAGPTVHAGEQLRFGPGVPVAPPTAPAWPGPARRPRPRWRRLVSVLSSLLTLVLLGVVGLYLWQRLSPLVVEGVTVAVPQPAGDRCDVTVPVVATVRTNGRGGTIRYQWFRSDAASGAMLTERVGRGQRTVTLTLKWAFSGVGTAAETATVNIVEPTPVQAGTRVAYHCRG
ncbi:hypothetical protein ACWT_3033 [Actinoplanes sp. SE50]|uniref:hypothetical protein n=1 Tax=unclassified Actinoplanes TaxID=2626549 RepID=UPI00023EC0BF|nr:MULTISPECIES: hypothetical protein [unclassified Actinoplanes]AEV84056.1 hypothetical protein ACPL_3161 [Actinoplanes sp. SE50/110]ATO82448.1 hypothetical protein ACWT_3033 [Actinoplanes sp. SE50]SLL99855.1 hypothetical protein ACSP50_3087 [Actinoplanes sp. SE50/110]